MSNLTKTADKQPNFRVFEYDKNNCQKRELKSLPDMATLVATPSLVWLDVVDGINLDILANLAKQLKWHHLVTESLSNSQQRPKLEDYGDYLFLTFKMVFYNVDSKKISAEQISLVVGKNYLVSFQDNPQDVFEKLRAVLLTDDSRLRKNGIDYLAYALTDAVVDNYFLILEKIGEQIEALENKLVDKPLPSTARIVHGLRRQLILLRKAVWPLREVVSTLERSDSNLIQKHTKPYLRELYDHTVQVMDSLETYRDMVLGLLDVYLSSESNRLNEVMKVLTIIATIFIPLTFIVGVYGMNFKYMPELSSPYGYPAVWLVIVVVAGFMLAYFKRKKWL
ncbi:magnesium/cobalt transporter CorA [Patescibacteria group bacterium]|nr:magnesium/cobalt transporter CorA [Patescibacteria group bacterium]